MDDVVQAFLIQSKSINFKFVDKATALIDLNLDSQHVTPSEAAHSDASWLVCHEVRKLLRENNAETKINDANTSNKSETLLMNRKQIRVKLTSHKEDYLSRIEAQVEGPILNHLARITGNDMQLQLQLSNMGAEPVPGRILTSDRCCWILKNSRAQSTRQNLSTLRMPARFPCVGDSDQVIFEGGLDGICSKKDDTECSFKSLQNKRDKEYFADLTVRIYGKLLSAQKMMLWKAGNVCNPVVATPAKEVCATGPSAEEDDLVTFRRTIFRKQVATDVELIAGDGYKIGCHKVFLTGNSPVFQRMLQGSTYIEGETNRVELMELNKVGLLALLSYLYNGDVPREVTKDPDICMELLETAEKYGITKLKEKMKGIFLAKPDAWFQHESSTLRLFCFSRNVEDCCEVKTKVVRVLQSNFPNLKSSKSFQQLLLKNAEAAAEIWTSTSSPQEF